MGPGWVQVPTYTNINIMVLGYYLHCDMDFIKYSKSPIISFVRLSYFVS